MRLKLKEYVSFNGFGDPDLPGAVSRALMEYFGNKVFEPDHRYMLLGEYPFEEPAVAGEIKQTRFSESIGSFAGQVTIGYDGGRFSEIVPNLIPADKMKTSVFYRIKTKGLDQIEDSNWTFYQVKGGNSFSIDLRCFLPNYDNFDEKTPAKRTIVADLSSSIIVPTGPTEVVWSKYGRESFFFRTEKVTEKKEVRLRLRCVDDQFKAAVVELRIIVLPNNWKIAALSAAGAFGLFVVTLGFTAVQKAIFSTEEVGTSKHPFSAMYESLSKLVSHCTSSWAMGLEYTLFFCPCLRTFVVSISYESRRIKGKSSIRVEVRWTRCGLAHLSVQ